jgi:pyrroline-5-carboxylate reductase
MTSLAIIGAGNMAEAIARGVIRAGVIEASAIIASDPSPQRREFFQRELGVRAVERNADAARAAHCVLLCVKPQNMSAALSDLASIIEQTSLIVSIAAGVTTQFIEKHLGSGRQWRVVRAMPNTPMLVGAGAVAMSAGTNATADDLAAARRLFETSAVVIEVSEDKLDAVTALSGSGPAYLFYLVEQMIAAGVANGLSENDSRTLVVQTAIGAAKMLAETTDSPQELRRKVTSPGGTTQAAIEYMEAHGLAPTTATRRARELSGGA